MMIREIGSFFECDGMSTQRRAQMMGALSPAARHDTLSSTGLHYGPIEMHSNSDTIYINVTAESPIPPIEWWNMEGNAIVSSDSASLTACKLITLLKNEWTCIRVTNVELKHEDEADSGAQKAILKMLAALTHDLTDLRLDNFYLNDSDALPDFRHLHNLFLSGFSGPLQKWSGVLNNSAERVEICDTVAFTSNSFSLLRDNAWYRLILDNTNVEVSHLEQLKCRHVLKSLSLIDCRKIDSFDATLFPELRLLLLGRTPISSDWFTGIETCSHLHLINLGGCHEITDINALSQLKEIREVFAHETGVTNDGIAGLSECENLEKLNLGGCRNISNVNHLGRLAGLKELHLWSTKVSNTGIQDLCCCTSLAELILDDCNRITDVAPLGHLPSLRWLSLIGTEVNGQGIRELIHCRSLETLALAGTRVDKPPKLWRHETVIEFLSGFQ